MGKSEDAWWEERTLPQKVAMGIGFGILGIGFLALVGFVTMSLWNALMPEIFGLKTITYWQTWGLLILSCIFFKNFGSGSNNNKRKERKRKKELRRYMEDEPQSDRPVPEGQEPDPAEEHAEGRHPDGPSSDEEDGDTP